MGFQKQPLLTELTELSAALCVRPLEYVRQALGAWIGTSLYTRTLEVPTVMVWLFWGGKNHHDVRQFESSNFFFGQQIGIYIHIYIHAIYILCYIYYIYIIYIYNIYYIYIIYMLYIWEVFNVFLCETSPRRDPKVPFVARFPGPRQAAHGSKTTSRLLKGTTWHLLWPHPQPKLQRLYEINIYGKNLWNNL